MPVDVIASPATNSADLMAAAIFENAQQAETAFTLLLQTGFDARSISILQRRGDVLEELETPTETTSVIRPDEQPLAEDPAMGAVSGAAIGGAAGAMIGLALVAVPVIGPFLAGGALATMLGSAAIGALAGGVGGALLLWGAPEDLAHHYAGQLEGSRCLLVVETAAPDEQDQAAQLLERAGGRDIHTFQRHLRE